MQIVAGSHLITEVITSMQMYLYWAVRYEITHQVTYWVFLTLNSTDRLQNTIDIFAVHFKSLIQEFMGSC